MEILFDLVPITEAVYDLQMNQQMVLEEIITVSHMYTKTQDNDILTEGVSDIITLVVNGIKAFNAKIKALINKCFATLNSYYMEYDKLIDKYGDAILKANIEPFTIEGFTFTVLDNPRPNVTMVGELVDQFNKDLAKFHSLSIEQIREMNAEATSDMRIEKLRSEILGGKPSRIATNEFKSYVFKFYRNGLEYPTSIEITKDMIAEIVENKGVLTSEKKATQSQKDSVMGILTRMEKLFSMNMTRLFDDVDKVYNVPSLKKNGLTSEDATAVEDTELCKLMLYMNMRYQQVVELMNIVSITFVERTSAIKDQVNQELQIFRMALRHINPTLLESTDAIFESVNSFPPTPNTDWVPITEGMFILEGEI